MKLLGYLIVIVCIVDPCLGERTTTSGIVSSDPQDPAWKDDQIERLLTELNPELNLWTNSRGIHHVRGSAKNLLIAAELNLWDELPTSDILAAIRSNQVKTGELRGNFKWNHEDEAARDTHSGFFTILPLIVLYLEYPESLTTEQSEILRDIFDESLVWFRANKSQLDEKRLRYPNVMLSEVTALWLVSEINHATNEDLESLVRGAFRYFRESNWGWGEHLSNLYGRIAQDALAIFLLYAERATPAMNYEAHAALQELINIEAQYAGGPFVPTIRCFAFDWSPRTPSTWNGWFRPLLDPGDSLGWGQNAVFRLMVKHGLNTKFDYHPGKRGDVTVDSYRPSQALAWIDENWRLGVFSHYPLTVDVNEITHGLLWQSMPMAFWHARGDWAYLQWQTEENGRMLRAPHNTRGAKRGKYSRVLSNESAEAKLGHTYGIRHGHEFLVYRRLPAVAPSWTSAGDRFRIINPTHDQIRQENRDGWITWNIPMGEETLTVAFKSLSGPVESRIETLEIGETEVHSETMDYLEKETLHEGESGESNLEITWDIANQLWLGGVWYFHVQDGSSPPPDLDRFGSDLHRIQFADGSTCLLHPTQGIPWTPIVPAKN